MDSQPFSYKQHVIVPFASVSKLGYAASVFVTRPTGKCSAFGILAYFVSENAALQYGAAYAKAHIDGTTLPKPRTCLHTSPRFRQKASNRCKKTRR
jgi:hypothetical protein